MRSSISITRLQTHYSKQQLTVTVDPDARADRQLRPLDLQEVEPREIGVAWILGIPLTIWSLERREYQEE